MKGKRKLFREPSGKVLLPEVALMGEFVEELYIMLFTASYVVKNAPARLSREIGWSAVMFLVRRSSIRANTYKLE